MPQIFLHCCRCWWLTRWVVEEQSSPYWRLFWQSKKGSRITVGGISYDLTNDRILLISPNTPYSSHFVTDETEHQDFCIIGGPVNTLLKEPAGVRSSAISQLHIYFNLGLPFDTLSGSVFEFPVSRMIRGILEEITGGYTEEGTFVDRKMTFTIHSLLNSLLMKIPEDGWKSLPRDLRIVRAVMSIDRELRKNHSNRTLADSAGMAVNSFARLFAEQVGLPPQKYLQSRRIQKACVLLHHTSFSIEDIGEECGFCDRYHFSRTFKKQTGISPGHYRKIQDP